MSHALLGHPRNVLMVYFVLQALRAATRVHFTVVLHGKKRLLPVLCPVKVDLAPIVLMARNALVTLPAQRLILFTVVQALMKLLQLARILVPVVSTENVRELRRVTSILPATISHLQGIKNQT
jgi:hypothetical protein